MMSEFKQKQQKNATIYVTTIVAFFVLNIFNTYFITTNVLNKHMVTFNRSALGEFNSFIGNFIVVFLIYIFVTAITKQARRQILGLVIATFLLNLGVFALYIFTKYYGTTFSIHDLTLFNNPSAVLVGSIFIESIKDLFVYFR